jgi:hypothetical protein
VNNEERDKSWEYSVVFFSLLVQLVDIIGVAAYGSWHNIHNGITPWWKFVNTHNGSRNLEHHEPDVDFAT